MVNKLAHNNIYTERKTNDTKYIHITTNEKEIVSHEQVNDDVNNKDSINT